VITGFSMDIHIRIHSGAHLAWKKGVCRGRAAFDITFQHKTTFSFTTRNRPMNFAILPNFGNPSCYFVPFLGCAALRLQQVVGNTHTTPQLSPQITL